MSALSGVTVEGPAYLKLMLHTAKYPWASVGGFLLGESAASSTEKIVVKDAVPLFHTSTLAPLLEMSATMVEAYAAKNGFSIVGFYQASQSLAENTTSVLASKIMSQIDAARAGSSVLLVVNNKNLEVAGNSAVSAFARDGSGSFRKPVVAEVSMTSILEFESALSRRAEMDLVDMDEHLDDVSKDWRNTAITASSSA